ncbi:MAG: metallophosphoesterase [Flavobacterium sp.]|jgi:predicted MPP superfamily phosphohydrolase|uniref:metallophosphoesterase n=1 Tax=Flavobacterium sp. TaxID=239 RepID=UPI0022BF0342|nr:metallophosphoesterase [Flavobacterium sp.]MCZ8167742.1 metallophosphoesterase [Flavobacterium sp.]MCZ8297609.1 metallophosphoesterase [Flavobacterium sp.]
MTFRLFILLVLLTLIEVYAFQAVRTVTKTKWVQWTYLAVSLGTLFFVFYQFTKFDRKVGQTPMTMLTIGLLLLVLVPKLIMILVLLAEDMFRLVLGAKNFFVQYDAEESYIPARRKFVSQLAIGLAAVPFLSLVYGMTKGKYNFKVRKETLYFDDLPEDFDGFTFTQISDIHSGSFDDPEKIAHAIDIINAQASDMLLFTGDIVNTHATEMHPWVDLFSKIKSHPFGKYSVLGNHDYGEYIEWNSAAEKEQNFKDIIDLHHQIDFKLLRNEHVNIQKGASALALVGVENWGVKFKKAGDLAKASAGLDPNAFKILMSHDPSHWEVEVKSHPEVYHLTLSGHTHGLQFGIEIPGFIKWSPVQYVYKQWAGLYEHTGRYLYVNRGFGFHAYPGRVGIMPEITVLTLKKGRPVA